MTQSIFSPICPLKLSNSTRAELCWSIKSVVKLTDCVRTELRTTNFGCRGRKTGGDKKYSFLTLDCICRMRTDEMEEYRGRSNRRIGSSIEDGNIAFWGKPRISTGNQIYSRLVPFRRSGWRKLQCRFSGLLIPDKDWSNSIGWARLYFISKKSSSYWYQ